MTAAEMLDADVGRERLKGEAASTNITRNRPTPRLQRALFPARSECQSHLTCHIREDEVSHHTMAHSTALLQLTNNPVLQTLTVAQQRVICDRAPP